MHDDNKDEELDRHAHKIVQVHESNHKAIFHLITRHMMGEYKRLGEKSIPQPVPYPVDAEDFRYVNTFLDEHPDWRKRLGELALYSQRWMILSENWDRLNKLSQSQDEPTFSDTLRQVMSDAIDVIDARALPSAAFRKKVRALVEEDSGIKIVKNLTLREATQWGNELARLLEQENCQTYTISVGNKELVCSSGAKNWQSGTFTCRRLPEDFAGQKGPAHVKVAFSRNALELPEQPERGDRGDEGMSI